MDRSKDIESWDNNKGRHSAAGMKCRSHAKFAVALREVDDKLDFNNSQVSFAKTATTKKLNKRKRDAEEASSILNPSLAMDSSAYEATQPLPKTTTKVDVNQRMMSLLDEIAQEQEGEAHAEYSEVGKHKNEDKIQEPARKRRKKGEDFEVSSTPIETIASRLKNSSPIIIPDQTPLKELETSPISPIVPQSLPSFPTPNFPATQAYASQSFAPTQVYRSPMELKKIVPETPVRDDAVRRLDYKEDIEKNSFLVPTSPVKLPTKPINPKGRRKRGKAAMEPENIEMSDAPIEAVELPKENLTDSVPLFDEQVSPTVLAEKCAFFRKTVDCI
jgi:hypothetical protein